MRSARWFVMIALLVALGATASAQIVITEIIQNPAGVGDSSGEFFEILNTSDSDVDINGWTIMDNGTDSHVIDNGGSLLVTAGGYLVLGINIDFATNGGVTVDYQYSGISLGNSDDEVILKDTELNTIDEVWYDGGPNFPDPNGASMFLVDVTADNNIAGVWQTSTIAWGEGTDAGSPGAANEAPKYADFNNVDVEAWTWRTGEVPPDYFFTSTAWLGASNFIAQNQVDVHGGSNAVMMGMINQAENSFLYQSLEAIPDAAYLFSAWLKDNDADISGNLSIVFYDDDNNQLGSFNSDATVDGDSYVQHELEATAPAGATRMQVGVAYVNTNSSDTHYILADDFAFGAAPPPPPVVTLQDVQTNAELMDTEVTTGGIVMNTDGLFSTSYTKVFIQDGTGYGVQLYDSSPGLLSTLAIGDSIIVTGTVDEYSGSTELVDFEVSVVTTGNDIPEPIVFESVYDATNAQAMEASYAQVSGVIQNPVGTGSFNLYLTDGSAEVPVRFHSNLGADLTGLDTGDTLTVAGVIAIYSGAVQIYPTMDGDWTIGGRIQEPTNWSFEEWNTTETVSWPAGWQITDIDNLVPAQSTENVLDGDYSAQLTLLDSENSVIVRQVIWSVENGGYYAISANVYDNDPGAEAFLNAYFLDEDGEMVGGPVTTDPTVDQASYQELAFEASGFEGIVAVAIEIHVTATASFSESAVVYLDGFVGEAYSPYTIADIQTGEDVMGRAVVVQGVVTQSANTTSTSFNDVYIQDDSGYGIMLYSGDIHTDLVRGSEVNVRGYVDAFNGITEIVDFEYDIVATGVALPAPLVATTGEMAANQAYEGTWAEVTGYIQNNVGTPSWTLYVNDGSGDVQIRVWSDTGIDLTAFERYDAVTVRGTIDLYNGAVQIQPSEQADIEAAAPFTPPSNLTVEIVNGVPDLSWTGAELDETFLYYAVYRNGQLVATVTNGTEYVDMPFDFGDLSYFVRAYYDVGVSAPTNVVDIAWDHPVWAPEELSATDVSDEGEVTLSWVQGGRYGEGVYELISDEASWAGSYIWPGNTMAAHFSVDTPVEVIGIKYFTTIIPGERQFNAELYEWDGENGVPASTTPVQSTATMGADDAWVVVDLMENPYPFDSDFVVGFGSIDNSVALGFEDHEGATGTWDLASGEWSQNTDERYGIRVIVQTVEPVGDGQIMELIPGRPVQFTGTAATEKEVRAIRTNELDDLTGYTILLGDTEVGTTNDLFFDYTLEAFGEYTFSVVANYDEGPSDPATVNVNWQDNNVGENTWSGIPTEFAIAATYPNPFNPSMQVVLAIPEKGHVEAQIFDVLGRRVATLTSGDLSAGYHRYVWQPQNLPTGMYFLRMQSSTGFVASRKVMFMK